MAFFFAMQAKNVIRQCVANSDSEPELHAFHECVSLTPTSKHFISRLVSLFKESVSSEHLRVARGEKI